MNMFKNEAEMWEVRQEIEMINDVIEQRCNIIDDTIEVLA